MASDHALETQRTKQTSFYLVRRADALLGALKFFAQNHADARRHLQFLAQIDFWAWELDNLIYSFTNLRERQKTWQSQDAIEKKMAHLGIALQARRTRKVRWREGQWQAKQAGERVAPVALLREVIDAWNELVAHTSNRGLSNLVMPRRGGGASPPFATSLSCAARCQPIWWMTTRATPMSDDTRPRG